MDKNQNHQLKELTKCYILYKKNQLASAKGLLAQLEIVDQTPLPVRASYLWMKALLHESLNSFDEQQVMFLLTHWTEATENFFGQEKDVYTSNLALYYAALLAIKNRTGNYELQKSMTEIRDYIFEHLLKKGSLIASLHNQTPAFDQLLAVLPYGLFAPEDLIVVEAVTKLTESIKGTQAQPFYASANALLGIYYTEKFDLEQAQQYLLQAKAATADQYSDLFTELLNVYLTEKKKNVSETPFIHKPLGHGNVYHTLPVERSPHYPEVGDECLVNVAVTSDREPMLAFAKVNLKIACQLIDQQRNIYQGKFIVTEELINQEYFFYSQKEHQNICSSAYLLEVSQQEAVETIQFLGSTKDTNIYELKTVTAGSLYLYCDAKKLYFSAVADIKPKFNRVRGQFFSLESLEVDGFAICLQGEIVLKLAIENPIKVTSIVAKGIVKLHVTFRDQSDTCYYGFGERYNCLNQFGHFIDCFVYNQYRDQGTKTYLPIPYFVTNKQYGLFVDTNYYTTFDLQATKKKHVTVTAACDAGKLQLPIYLLKGQLRELVSEYITISGEPKMIPAWALGPWMSSNNWDREQVVRDEITKTNAYEIPATVIVLEQWSDETTYYMFNDAEYSLKNPAESHTYEEITFPAWGRWPNPKQLVEDCHQNGLKLLLWQVPIVKYLNQQKHPLKDLDEAYMLAQGYSVKNSDGSPYRIPENWFTDSLLLDFTNQEAKNWWFEKRQYLVEIGVDGFKTDGGEMVFGSELMFADGSTGKEMRNRYPNEYVQAYYEFAQQNQGLTFSRASYKGAQRFPAHWAGDERSTFAAFKRSLIAGINAGYSGVIFWGWDLAGFNGEIPTDELFMRSTAMATFCPIMQYHAESKGEFNQDRTPWNIAERTGNPQVIDVYRFFATVRMNLLPYIYSQAIISCQQKQPLMRALKMVYELDSQVDAIYDQYMFGEALLIAPVIEEGKTERLVYLPAGCWTDFWTHETQVGARWVNCLAAVNQIPVYIKENSVVLLNLALNNELGNGISNDISTYQCAYFVVTVKTSFEKKLQDHLGNQMVVKVTKRVGSSQVTITGIANYEVKLIDL